MAVYSLFINYHKGFRAFFSESSMQNEKIMNDIENKFGVSFYEEFVKAQEVYLSSMNMVYLFSVPAIALLTYWFFKSKYNYAENLAIHCYLYGTANWVSFLLVFLTLFIDMPGNFMFFLIVFTYLVIAYLIKHIYQLRWVSALAVQLLLLFVFMIIGQVYLYSLFAYFMIVK